MAGQTLGRGDIIRLPRRFKYYDDKTKPMDLLVGELPSSDSGMAIICLSGWDSGWTWMYLPKESRGSETIHSIDISWLLKNWSRWFAYETGGNKPVVLPIEDVVVLKNGDYQISPTKSDQPELQ